MKGEKGKPEMTTVINPCDAWIGETKWCTITELQKTREMYRRIYFISAVYDCPKQLHIVKGMRHRQTSRVKGYDFKDFIFMRVQKMTDPAQAGGKKYRVIHKSLRDFRTRLRNNQDRHGRKEHINK